MSDPKPPQESRFGGVLVILLMVTVVLVVGAMMKAASDADCGDQHGWPTSQGPLTAVWCKK